MDGFWDSTSQRIIDDVIKNGDCPVAFSSTPPVKVGSHLPFAEKQSDVIIDVIHLEGLIYLLAIDECTTWPEAVYNCRKMMDIQSDVLCRIQFLPHGAPICILSDREYDNPQFKKFCDEQPIKHILVAAANDHEAIGPVESANCTQRSFSRRLRLCGKRSSTDTIVAGAIHGEIFHSAETVHRHLNSSTVVAQVSCQQSTTIY